MNRNCFKRTHERGESRGYNEPVANEFALCLVTRGKANVGNKGREHVTADVFVFGRGILSI